jgi:hypothetical protein
MPPARRGKRGGSCRLGVAESELEREDMSLARTGEGGGGAGMESGGDSQIRPHRTGGR